MIWLALALVFLLIVLAVVAALVLAQRRRMEPEDEEAWPFYAKKPLTEPEQVLYHRLVKALPECIVLAQVQLSRLLGVKKDHSFAVWNNRISQKSVDFVVCLKDATIVAVVELDDSTHKRTSRQKADAQKDKALSAAGVAIIRWTTSAMPDEAAIRLSFVK